MTGNMKVKEIIALCVWGDVHTVCFWRHLCLRHLSTMNAWEEAFPPFQIIKQTITLFFFLKKRLNLPLVKSQESKFCLININLFNKTIMLCLRFDQINNEYIYFDWKLAILAFQHIVEYSLFTYVATLSIFRWWIKEHCVKWSISSILFLNLTLL